MSRITTLVGMISLAAIYTFVYHIVPWPTTIAAPDWGTWIGAIGTVGTLVGTLYIATSETRRRRSEEVIRANITAAALAPRVEMLSRQLRAFQNSLMFRNLAGDPYSSPAEEAAFLLAIRYVPATTDELLSLAALDDGFASKLAYAQGRLEIIHRGISEFAAQSNGSPLRIHDAQKWEKLSDELAERFSVIAARCVQAARTHAPAPTPEEIYGPQ